MYFGIIFNILPKISSKMLSKNLMQNGISKERISSETSLIYNDFLTHTQKNNKWNLYTGSSLVACSIIWTKVSLYLISGNSEYRGFVLESFLPHEGFSQLFFTSCSISKCCITLIHSPHSSYCLGLKNPEIILLLKPFDHF